jgi:hypothetical protein
MSVARHVIIVESVSYPLRSLLETGAGWQHELTGLPGLVSLEPRLINSILTHGWSGASHFQVHRRFIPLEQIDLGARQAGHHQATSDLGH